MRTVGGYFYLLYASNCSEISMECRFPKMRILRCSNAVSKPRWRPRANTKDSIRNRPSHYFSFWDENFSFLYHVIIPYLIFTPKTIIHFDDKAKVELQIDSLSKFSKIRIDSHFERKKGIKDHWFIIIIIIFIKLIIYSYIRLANAWYVCIHKSEVIGRTYRSNSQISPQKFTEKRR